MPITNFTSGDFQEIKGNLIEFFSGQDEFADFNFAGRRLNVLADLLAYGDTYAQKFSSSLYNESFILSARLRSSIVLHAQQKFFYEPRSIRASHAKIRVVFSDEQQRSSILIPRGTVFEAQNANDVWPFVLNEGVVVARASDGTYPIELDLHQGDIVTRQRQLGDSRELLIRSDEMDRSTLKIEIDGSAWNRENNSARVLSDSQVYYTREDREGNTVVYFGTGAQSEQVITGFGGLRPDALSTVVFSYIDTDGEQANGSTGFNLASGPDSGVDVVSVDENPSGDLPFLGSTGGAARESTQSIVFNAPRWRRASERCVSPSDYNAHVQKVFGNIIETAQTWTDPNNTGFAFISAKAFGSFGTPTDVKADIESYLSDLNVSVCRPIVVDPDVLLLQHDLTVEYTIGTQTESELTRLIIDSVSDYYQDEISVFGGSWYNSRLLAAVDSSSDSIKGSSSSNRLVFNIRDTAEKTIVKTGFKGNAIVPGSLVSDEFDYASDEFVTEAQETRVVYKIRFRSTTSGDLLLGPFKPIETSITAAAFESTSEGNWFKVGSVAAATGKFDYSFFELGSPRDRIAVTTIEFSADTNLTTVTVPNGSLILFDARLRPDLFNITFNAKTEVS